MCLTASNANAQTYQAWVDPTLGTGAGTVSVGGLPPAAGATPFSTISAAIGAIAGLAGTGANPALSAANTGLVHCMPGIYSPGTNLEPLPIVMVDFISLVGTAGAKGTIVRGLQTTAYGGPGVLPAAGGVAAPAGVYLPTLPNSRSVTQEVLFDGSGLNDLFPEVIDGFTTRGGDIQFYIEAELASKSWTIANCVLDMLNGAPEIATPAPLAPLPIVPGPTFGVLQVVDYFAGAVPYLNIQTNFLNNTVVMGWQSGPDVGGVATVCRPGAVAFCDVTDPLTNPAYPPYGADPLARQVGFSPINIQNNIFRTLPAQQATGTMAMIGVDASDTATSAGTRIGPTNAFAAPLAGTLAGGGPATPPLGALPVFFSGFGPGGVLPAPWIDVNPANPPGVSGAARDPAFVGEYLSRQAAPTAADLLQRDWRILPSSPYVEAGSAPTGLLSGVGVLTAANTIASYARPTVVNLLLEVYDYDGEGYGNPRVAATPLAPLTPVATVDIGFDEASNLIAAGSHANDSICHNTAATTFGYPAFVGVGQPLRTVIYPAAGVATIFNSLVSAFAGGTGVVPVPPWSTIPSAAVIAPSSVFPIGYSGIYVLPPFVPLIAVPVAAAPAYFAPNEAPLGPGALQTVASLAIGDPGIIPPGAAPFYTTWQNIFTATGLPGVVTNAQSEQY